MKVNVYLDDLRDCPEGFMIARTVADAITIFSENEIRILSLDHDLGCDVDGNLLPSGYDFVKRFCELGLFAEDIYIHTDNPVGRKNMYETLLAAQRRGFIDTKINIHNYPIVPNKYTSNS